MEFRCVCGKVISTSSSAGAIVRCPACGQLAPVPGVGAPASPVWRAPAPVATAGLATASLVLGLLSIALSLLAGIPAIVCGALALSRIGQSRGRLGGQGQAVAGLMLGGIFTLIGLMVGVGLLFLWGGRGTVLSESRLQAARAQQANFQSALDRYKLDLGRYPTTEQGLTALVTPPSDLPPRATWHGPYLASDAIPPDPWGLDYRYACPGEHRTDGFDLWSAGPDGADGTEDDIGNW
jgi:general secretion pathway protein G